MSEMPNINDTSKPIIPIIPDILTRASSERFRRHLLIASRLLAILLIVAIFYFGYVNYKYGEFVKSFDGNPCFACGYRYSMKCDYVYVDHYLNDTQKEGFLMTLGLSNINQSPVKYTGSLAQLENINLSGFNVSTNT